MRGVAIAGVLVAACSADQDAGNAPQPPLIETGAPDLPDQPPLYNYASIKTAIAEAQETLPVFWGQFDNPASGTEQFRVKIIHPSDEYERDYVWVEYLQQASETEWRGSVMIENGGNDRFQTGLTVFFDQADIVDWGYTENGLMRGSYTSRAMLGLAPDADTSAIAARFHDSPVPE
ncbi:MAG: hypothetical protein Hens3KO_02370 [Henriciella sp.]